MKKMSKKVKLLLMVIMVISCIITVSSVYANISTNFPESDNHKIDKVDTSVKKIWGSVVVIVQVLAFAAIIFAGLRYMFASADRRADIKRGLIMLALGAILVFATSTIVSFVVNVTNDALQ